MLDSPHVLQAHLPIPFMKEHLSSIFAAMTVG